MIKKIAWEMFEKTGNINTFMAFKNIEQVQKNGIDEMENYQNDIVNEVDNYDTILKDDNRD